MIDYEGMILARQEQIELMEDCNGDCDYCRFKRTVEGTDERIDREPAYYCGLFDETKEELHYNPFLIKGDKRK